ncbi:MAG: anti-anti-sigma factor [Burkholderiales bacterium RIFCSPLOWO2_02_FULL_57_36]|nr:MAG: anti-anti-sigma factor [Burkholderiales bacterium RIFCSPLOWO2_02_FULL_57_36]
MFRPTLTLTVNNAKTALDAGLSAIENGQTEIDLAQLTVVDSAAVATMVAWRRAALDRGASLTFRNAPANLRSLAELYDVAELLHQH